MPDPIAVPPVTGFTVNEAEALFDGDAYEAMLTLLARARRSLRVEFFLFGGPHAETMINVLAAKQAQGVSVRVTLDRTLGLLPLVRRECRAAYRHLRRSGIDVVLSDMRPFPNSPTKPGIAHNKIIVADDREALVGGMNVGSLFFHHHDVMIRLVGPAAHALGRQFDYDRQFVTDSRLARLAGSPPLPAFAENQQDVPAAGQTQARIVGTGVGRRTTKEALWQNLRAAQSSVCVAMCEMGQTDLLDELIQVRGRGVDVRVLLDPQRMDAYLPGPVGRRVPAGILNAGAVRTLLEAGIDVRLYRVGSDFHLMHLKMALFDHKSAVVGSTNWTRGGFEWVGETDVELHGGVVVNQLQAQFERDWHERSVPARPPARAASWLHGLYVRYTE
jgi:phosphatidylserine/phosphatidylglycerophosphate/cardiolipin synthase-like enzyme